MPEGLYLIVEEESLQKADCAVQQQNLCSPQWSYGSSLVPPINNDPTLVKELESILSHKNPRGHFNDVSRIPIFLFFSQQG